MLKNSLYRNARAGDLLDTFLVSAVSSVLIIRFYLYLTGYPQIGSGPLHVAHVLFGGLLMMSAIVLVLTFLGSQARRGAAILGGIGFGMFIDELGKFITEDNDYFFEPTIGLIYALFVVLYLTFNFLARDRALSSTEYQINALDQLEEAIANDMDSGERKRIYALLDASREDDTVTRHLRKFVDTLEISGRRKHGYFYKFGKKIDRTYAKFWEQRQASAAIKALFIFEILFLTGAVAFTVFNNIDDVRAIFDGIPSYGEELLIGQVLSSIAAAFYVLKGIRKLPVSRLKAFEDFRKATLINIYLTQFFIFARVEFEAMPGLIANIILLLLITFAMEQEVKLGRKRHHAASK